ncbi:MAG: IS66 family transposase [Thermoplasmata archaeon]
MKRTVVKIKENKKLKKENEQLKKEIEELKERITKLAEEKKKVEKEYKEYRMRHPEIVGVKGGKPYAIKEKVRTATPRKKGAKKGHKPRYRKLPKLVDKTIDVPVNICPDCGGDHLSENVQEQRTRTVEDIPPVYPVVTKYVIERRYCRDCEKLVETVVTDALPNARLGLRTMLTVVYLKVGLRLPVGSIVKLLKDIYNLKISEGEVCNILERIADEFGQYYDQLVGKLREAPVRYMDETSWRIDGENVWLWAFVTDGLALYKIANSRCHKVPLKVLGSKPNGVDVHDRFSAYDTLAKKTGKRPQQICWSHLLVDSKELAKYYGEEGEHIHRVLKKIYAKAKSFDHQGSDENIKQLYMELSNELKRRYKSHRCSKFVKNLLKRKDSLFQFVKNPYVEGTNNRCERALRHSVIARKISGGNRTEKGARIYEKLTSVYHTMNMKNQNLIEHGKYIIQTSHG